jgi:hypothetical protein
LARVKQRRVACSLVVVLAGAGCAARATPAIRAGAPAASRPTEDEWSPLTWEERHDTMTFTVLPNMARLFQRFARADAPSLTCRSCHGADAEKRAYAMPASLRPLDPKDPMAAKNDAEARLVRFMADEVTPTFAELTGSPRATCFSCHPNAAGSAR